MSISWLRLDADFIDHPKVVGLDAKAVYLFVASLCYAKKHLTDGHIPQPIARRYGAAKDANALVNAGLWHLNGNGYVIHDWHVYQETKAEVEAQRDEWRERKRKEREMLRKLRESEAESR